MSENLEAVIRDLLIHEKDSSLLASRLLQRLESDSLQQNEVDAFLRFLILSGHRKSSVKILSRLFQAERPIPLMSFCFILHQSGFRPGKEFLKHVITAHGKQRPEDQLQHFLPWEKYNSFFRKLRESTLANLKKLNLERKSRFVEKLEYLRNNRMINEEEKLLREIIEAYPEDEIFKKANQEFTERWARTILARKANPIAENTEHERAAPSDPEVQEITDVITQEMLKLAKQKPKQAYNFAMCFYFLEQYESAIKLLALAPMSIASDWFTLEVLLKAKRHVECLDAIANIEKRYADDPETTFAATYYRALALEPLGERYMATQLLKSIVHIRPSYRSAHSLLLKWGGLA